LTGCQFCCLCFRFINTDGRLLFVRVIHQTVLYHFCYVLMCRNIALCDYCNPILTALRWAKGCEPHLWQIGIAVNVAYFHPGWFEWSLMLVVRLNNVLVLLWWYVLWVGWGCKCEMWPTIWQGAVCHVQCKVQCSTAVSTVPCSAVGSVYVSFLHKEQYFPFLAFEQW
jgi:hypothetical protein